jgi:hypothetical protein
MGRTGPRAVAQEQAWFSKALKDGVYSSGKRTRGRAKTQALAPAEFAMTEPGRLVTSDPDLNEKNTPMLLLMNRRFVAADVRRRVSNIDPNVRLLTAATVHGPNARSRTTEALQERKHHDTV